MDILVELKHVESCAQTHTCIKMGDSDTAYLCTVRS